MRARLLVVISTALAFAAAAASGAEPASETCAMRLAEARFELDDLREEERLAPVLRDAEQDIFALVEPLWEANIAAKLDFLAHRYDRDAAAVDVPRSRIARERGEAKLAVIEGECVEGAGDAAASRRRYEELGCELVAKDRELAAVEEAYRGDVVKVLQELRVRELVTEQRVIAARFSVDRARAQLALRGERQRACRAALAAPPPEKPAGSAAR